MSFSELATRLIAKNGRSMVLREMVESGPAYDPTLTPSDTNVIGVMTEYSLSETNDIVQVGDKKVLIDSTVVPNPKMKLVDSGTEYEIVNVMEVKPGTESIMFKLQVRR